MPFLPLLQNADWVLATSEYGGEFVAAVQKGNVSATQFHPEKSGATGGCGACGLPQSRPAQLAPASLPLRGVEAGAVQAWGGQGGWGQRSCTSAGVPPIHLGAHPPLPALASSWRSRAGHPELLLGS